ncbi:Collectin-11 [Branchiostoma belcheri]|nr:Collectin-11 [Branchiostoma belcheri]
MSGSRRTYRTLPLDVPHSPAERIALSRRTSRTLPREVPHSVLHSPAERPSKIDAYFVAYPCAPQELTMDVRAVLVMLAVLMPLLLQASGQIVNINLNTEGNTGGRGTADKSQKTVMAERLKQTEGLHQDPATGTWLSQLDILDMSDTGRDMVIALLLQQNKEMQEQIKELQERDKDVADLKNQVKNLALDLCHTKMTCCNKTLTCPSGYKRFCERLDMCYKFSTNEKNYTDARSSCQADGGHLAMPKDKATNEAMLI